MRAAAGAPAAYPRTRLGSGCCCCLKVRTFSSCGLPNHAEIQQRTGRTRLSRRGRGRSDRARPWLCLQQGGELGDARLDRYVAARIEHLALGRADLMGYSLGSRISAVLAARRPELVRSVILGGAGIRLVDNAGLRDEIAESLEAPSLDAVTDPMGKRFRAFAEQTRSDLKALAACLRGSRQPVGMEDITNIRAPALVAVGTKDDITGSPHELAALMPNARAIDIPDRDHMLAVGDKVFKAAAIEFLQQRP